MLASTMTKNTQRILMGVLLLTPLMAMAGPLPLGGTVPDVVSMLLNLDKNFPALMNMVNWLAYIFGVTFMGKAVWELRKYGEGISMVSQRDIRPTMVSLIVGTALIFIPSTLQTLLVTMYGSGVITGYTEHIPDTAWQLATITIVTFMQFIGFVAVVRGLLHLHKSANGQSQQNGFAKGIIHLVGGVLSINIIQAKDILYSTLGLMT